jgi:mitogen-activated protein kinase 15
MVERAKLLADRSLSSRCRAGPNHSRPNIAKMFPTANREAADLLQKLLVFDPEKRFTAADALRHPYVANFHDPANEPRCTRSITIPINDNEKVRTASRRGQCVGRV